MEFQNTEFIKSAVNDKNFIVDKRPQIAFAGRSNVGKSSVINSLVKRKNFARVGSQPGKTSQINYFLVDKSAYIVDLPGYGYAEVSKAERDRWAKLMESYFAAGIITMGVMIVDIRHKPTADDVTMAQWFKNSECPFVVVANKLDKAKKSEVDKNISLIRTTLAIPDMISVVAYSAEKGTGRDSLIGEIEKLLRS